MYILVFLSVVLAPVKVNILKQTISQKDLITFCFVIINFKLKTIVFVYQYQFLTTKKIPTHIQYLIKVNFKQIILLRNCQLIKKIMFFFSGENNRFMYRAE